MRAIKVCFAYAFLNLLVLAVEFNESSEEFSVGPATEQTFHFLPNDSFPEDWPKKLKSIDFTVDEMMDELEILMEGYFWRLKRVTRWTRFDINRFEALAENMGSELTDILEKFGTVSQCQILAQQLGFLTYMFRTMMDATETIRQHDAYRNWEDIMISNVCELNVRLFDLYNMYGKPDLGQKGYDYKVHRLKGILEFWKEDFALKYTLEGKMAVFSVYANQAERSLKTLESFAHLKWFPA